MAEQIKRDSMAVLGLGHIHVFMDIFIASSILWILDYSNLQWYQHLSGISRHDN